MIQYGKIVSWLEMEYGLSEKESKASDSFLLAAFLNLAMCYLKLREYTKAVECCDKVRGQGFAFIRPLPVSSLSVSKQQLANSSALLASPPCLLRPLRASVSGNY